ncbi:MAG TPA: hypothetical protein VJU59_40160 [Paraburkholderia sp.]|uniref:hypothetical protein n=1 Tax=Paraburkholderia sp. TaxID=1926495 RepID=UPI002B4832A4|nr:hypothetical protein [Paraburkholderia sp.]HKR45813.1 hypothetical protein [Paraburkholderia sp.]
MTTNPPQAHAFLLDVAWKLLQKADRATGERNVRLRLDEKTVPSLYQLTDGDALRLHELLIEELAASGWIRLHMSPQREFAGFLERAPVLELLDFASLASWAKFESRKEAWDRQLLGYLNRVPENSLGVYRDALIGYFARNPLPALQGLPHEEVLSCVVELASVCQSAIRLPLRELSAKIFHGRSKVLDNRGELLRLLGASDGQFYEPPVQLLTSAPPDFTQALFVENLVTFERMADTEDARWRGIALVFASGFRGSARRLRKPDGSTIYIRARRGGGTDASPAALSRWLYDGDAIPVRFFGDLDYSGINILSSLREVFPSTQAWRPGYQYLAQLLCMGGGHLPDMADKEGQVEGVATGCDFSDKVLVPLMRATGRFVDQEAFVVAD